MGDGRRAFKKCQVQDFHLEAPTTLVLATEETAKFNFECSFCLCFGQDPRWPCRSSCARHVRYCGPFVDNQLAEAKAMMAAAKEAMDLGFL